jgi:hypothetical protein
MSQLDRRDFFLLAGGASLLAAASRTMAAPIAAPMAVTRTTFSFGESRFPIVLAGESAKSSDRIRSLDFFMPLFGGERKVVNPALPEVTNNGMRFMVPGEYYLRINNSDYLKAVVLDPSEGTKGGLLRLFDFFVANNLYIGVDDYTWYTLRIGYMRTFFRGCEPMMLSCGPTHQVFREWVRDRFAVPTRIVTFATTRLLNGMVVYASHNLPEIYVPELGKFVMFDLNSNFVPKWLDAMEIAEVVHSKRTDDENPNEDWRDYGIDFHAGVEARPANMDYLATLRQRLGFERVAFEPELVATGIVNEDRASALRCFYGGAGYWGKNIQSVQPTGTEFLDGDVLWASLQTNPLLVMATTTWMQANQYPMQIVDPVRLREQLDNGHHEAIAAAAWRSRFPAA